jgi:uncharacterized protein
MQIDSIKSLFEPVLSKTSAEMVYLFGSMARGTADPYSDVDLVIVADTKRPFVERFKDFMDLLKVSPSAVEMLVYTREEFNRMRDCGNGFIQNVLKEGKIIYERPTAGAK